MRGRLCLRVALIATVMNGLAARAGAAPIPLTGPITNPSNGHTYYLLESDFWESSEAAAVSLGGHLVTINDLAENDWVWDTFAAFGGTSRTLWTGYRRVIPAGPFSWVSGEPSVFENWFPGEPNNTTGAENYAPFVPPAQSPSKQWFDMYASTTYFDGPINGVVEVAQQTVPEPASLILLGTGLVAAGARRRRNRQANA